MNSTVKCGRFARGIKPIARADLSALFDARNATSDEAFLACWFSDEAQRVLGEMVAMLKAKRG